MSTTGKVIGKSILIAICLALFIPAYFYFKNNQISKANRLKSEAKREYFAREYLKAYHAYAQLLDSLQILSDAASINYANAAFMSSNILLNGFYGSSGQVKLPDSSLQALADISQAEYIQLTSSKDAKIASIAANQLGYSMIKGGNLFEDESTDSVLTSALDHFKNALRKNPANDSARYNYELIKKIVLFPESILSQTKALVAQQRYREAASLLERSMKRDPRLRKQEELLNRIKTIIQIDSVNTARI